MQSVVSIFGNNVVQDKRAAKNLLITNLHISVWVKIPKCPVLTRLLQLPSLLSHFPFRIRISLDFPSDPPSNGQTFFSALRAVHIDASSFEFKYLL